MGLLSPFGSLSDLKRHNQQIRESEPQWPAHWISFWHGNDGDYCFSFDKDGHAWVVYWNYNNFNADPQSAHLAFKDDCRFANFAEWFSGQVVWALDQDRA